MLRTSIWAMSWGLLIFASPAYAHRPTMSDVTAIDAVHAIEFQDVQISRVVYHEVTKQAQGCVWDHVRPYYRHQHITASAGACSWRASASERRIGHV